MTGVRRISLLVNVLGSGGAQRRLADLANRFVALGRRVEVISVDPGGPMRAMLAPEVEVLTLLDRPNGRLSTALHAHRLAARLAAVRPAILMSCVTDTHLLAVAATRLDGRRTPLVLRASRHPYRPVEPPWKRVVERFNLRKSAWCYARADAIVALSHANRSGLEQLLGRSTPRIEVIANPVIEAVAPPPPRPMQRPPLILGIGRLVEQKDFATLVRAFARLRAERPGRLVILGDGPLRAALGGLAWTLGVGSEVSLPGEVADVPDWLARASLYVSSSRWEGLQSTLIEALAAGCPVVATDCPGGARETLRDGRLGPLVPVADPAALAAAMAATLDAPLPPQRLAAGAAPFTRSGKAEAYLSLFDALAADAPKAPAGAA